MCGAVPETSELKMHVTAETVAVLAMLVSVAAGAATNTSRPDGSDNLIRVYEVNKRVSQFPEKDDLSTPESAYVAINRVMAGGQEGKWREISVTRLTSRLPPADAPAAKVKPEDARTWLDAKIVEVRVFRGTLAVAITRVGFASGRFCYDSRSVELEDGRWLNAGQSIFDTIDEARLSFTRRCAERVGRPKWPPIADPDGHLGQFIDFLGSHAHEPKPFVMKALASHKIVIMGEIHHRPLYWAFNASLIADPEFARLAGTIYLELPSNDQTLVDQFLAADTLDTTPVIGMLRDMMEFGWPDQPMLDFFVAVWRANQNLPESQRLRIVLADMQRPWKDISTRQDLMKYHVDRDRYMADAILRDMSSHPDDKRNTLFIVGAGHTKLNLRYFDGTPLASAGHHLLKKLGRDQVYAFFPHTCVMTNQGRVDGRLCRGLFESAFAALENKPMAFPLDTGPFGEQFFDADPEDAVTSKYRDGYDAYLYLGPLESESFSPLIQGFYTDEFVKEIDRRYRIVSGRAWSDIYNRDPSAESFTTWLSSSWGRPRQDWRAAALGPLDVWKRTSKSDSDR